MSTTNAEPTGVVVGYDGSDAGARALRWAAEEAAARGIPVTVTHVWEFNFGASLGMPIVDLRTVAQEILEEGVERLRDAAPGLEVRSDLERGSAAAKLIELSGRAEMIVLGSRGLGGFAGLVLGSVSAQVAAHAGCPVVVLRGEPDAGAGEERGRVVVGVDGSAAARAALEMAFTEAEVHRVPLTAIVAWSPSPQVALPPLVDQNELGELAETRLARLLAPLRERHPEVGDVRTRVVTGVPHEVLLEASPGARLLVVGSRGLGGIRGLMLGSVSHALLHNADCPVAVVHGPEEPAGS
ncbi:universal stress protein [Actinomadura sp. NBRC 104412]|uniref:universal stress protein n=1 Tax=Actinomadura sp. NBRC 104412 TaxID=3032203 RepID=UPI0024A02BA6|nr:universal stress protein [Actinomadura sp. NBRC 104412]GLZ06558.1 universal stress protein [Actinomadura sp. NBRC 104412]